MPFDRSPAIDLFLFRVTDILNEIVKVHFEKDEARKKELEGKLQTETIPNNLKIFEKQLAENNGHLGGSSLNYADVSFDRLRLLFKFS